MRKNRYISVFLAIMMCLSIMSINVLAATGDFSKQIDAACTVSVVAGRLNTGGTMGVTVNTNSTNVLLTPILSVGGEDEEVGSNFRTGSRSFVSDGSGLYSILLYNNATLLSTTVTGSSYYFA